MADMRRSYTTTASYGLELNGVSVGFVESFEGGNATGEVVVESPGADGIAHKHLANVRYEEIALTCGATMSQTLYDWLATALNGSPTRQNGAVVAYHSDMSEAWRLNFFNALISEVGFPTLDGSSKDAATLSVKLAPEYTRRVTTGTGKASAKGSLKAKRWSQSAFVLSIDGLDCGKVNRIEAITVTQQVTQNAVGVMRDSQLLPGNLQVSNLAITMADSNAADFYDWNQSFLIEGNNGQNEEKNGALQFRAADMKDVLFTLQFNNLGIFRLAPVKASGEAVARVQAEMYCEQVLFMTGSAAASTTGLQPGTTASAQINVPGDVGQLGVAGTGMQVLPTPGPRAVSVPSLPVQVSAGRVTPSQGPRNPPPLQQQPVIPRSPTLRFRNLSSTAEIT